MSILKVPGAQLSYDVNGSGSPLVLIPGASGTGESFKPLIPYLTSHYQVITYDRRGFSRSPLDGSSDDAHRFGTDADDVQRLIEHLSDQPAMVFGSSSGALVALEVLIRYPERVQTLVAHEPPAVVLLPDAASWLAFFDGVYETYRRNGIPTAMQQFANGILGSDDIQALEQVRREHTNEETLSNTRYWMEHELRQYLRVELDLKVLTTHSERIVLGVGEDSQDQMTSQPNRVLAELLDLTVARFPSGHLGFLSAPDLFAKALVNILKRHVAPQISTPFARKRELYMSQSTAELPRTTPRPAIASRRKQPPGPLWPTALWNTIRFGRDPFLFLRELREHYGDLVTLPTIMGPWTLVFHPDGVRHVVQENHQNYRKGGPSDQVLRITLGNGLLTNNGDSWLTQRRLIQPAFHHSRIAGFGQLMTEGATTWLAETNLSRSEPLDLFQQMSGLTLTIVCQALFGADMLPYKQRVFEALSTAIRLEAQAFSTPGLIFLPTPQRRHLYEARDALYTIVDELIAQRRTRSTESKDDLLAMLLQARDAETGRGMNDQQLRDEVVTLMVAGHETTSGALAWTLLLLSQHPDIEARLREEYTRVLGGSAPSVEDLPPLTFGRMVLEESMCLYPPAWAFGRQALDEDEIGGYRIAKGAFVLMSPAVTHQHPDFWEQPAVFDPDRFDPSRASRRHRFAYVPFGGGPRGCIGNQFALTEAQLILATLLPRYQFRLLKGVNVAPEPLITLRPRGGLWMTAKPLEAR